MDESVLAGPDGQLRRAWCLATPAYRAYHDTEWGFPVSDDIRLFEKLCLEGFQAGLSWRTILEKRGNFRRAFDHFDFRRMALYTEADVERLMNDKGIVRHRGKITAAINNAQRALALVAAEGSIARFVWQYATDDASSLAEDSAGLSGLSGLSGGSVAPGDVRGAVEAIAAPRTTSPESVALSKALKRRGWKFVGPTTMYSFMQAMGLVNDHASGCAYREDVEAARRAFIRPDPG